MGRDFRKVQKSVNYKKLTKLTGIPKHILQEFIKGYLRYNKELPINFMSYLNIRYKTNSLDTNKIIKEFYNGKKTDYLYSLHEEMVENINYINRQEGEKNED